MNKTRRITNKTLCTVSENISVFILGGAAYVLAELIYRGYSHVTMFFAGGISFFLIYISELHTGERKLVYRCIIYAFMITALEFVFGVVFNVLLGMNVWDYSEEPLNVMGQVCPGFVLMWTALAFPAVFLCKFIRAGFQKHRNRTGDNALDN